MPERPGGKLVRDRDFTKFWAGETVALAGSQVTELALLLVAVVTLGASPFEIGLLNVARYAPIALSLLVGVWFDRNRRRPMLVTSNICRALLVAAVPLAAMNGVLTMELLYGIGLLLGLLTMVFDVGSLSYVPGLVGREHLAEANSKIQVSYATAAIAGPGLTGLLVAALSAPNALFVTTGCYAVSVTTLVLIKRRETAPDLPDEGTSVLASIREGLRSVFANSVLRNLASQSATFNLFENVMTTLFAVYAVRELGLSSAELGFVIGAGAVGALAGALFSARLTKVVGFGRTMRFTTLLACVSPLLILVASGRGPVALTVLAVALAVHGFNLAVFNVNALTLRQVVTPPGLLGRMNASYRLLLFGTIPLGALLGGVLASAFGLHTGLVIGLAGLVCPVLWLLFSPVFALAALPGAPESAAEPAAGRTTQEEHGRNGEPAMLSDTQRASFLARLRQGREGASDGIPRRPVGLADLPLSHGQEQLWFIDQLAPGLATYNIAGVLRIRGSLDTAALAAAVDGLVERHEVLRTRLVEVDGHPRQVIDPPQPGKGLPVVDLSHLDAGTRNAEWERLTGQEAERPFSLAQGPLLRTSLVRLGDDEHALLVVVHHIVFDGWSFSVLTDELLALYEAAVTGAPPALPELAVQFADFALWERDRLKGETLEELVGYWQETLSGVPTLQLPTDRPRPVVQTYDGAMETVTFPVALVARLKDIGRAGGTTLFSTLMAAFQVLLHRFSGQDDIVVGTVSANRSRSELAPLIGYLVNTLAVRSDLSGNPTFPELLMRVHASIVGAYAHQDLPFAKLVDGLRVHRDPSRHPVFQVGLQLAESYDTALTVAGLTVEQEALQSTAAKFDLLLSAAETPGGLVVDASYATALFDAGTIRRFLDHLEVLLNGIAAEPDRPLSHLPVLSAADRVRELVEWNDSARPFRQWALHQMFEAQVEATPEEVAVLLGEDQLTYAELNARANRVARRLRDLGARPEVLIGVCMQRSIDRMVAILGILKAGSGYVPLDPEYPADRLEFMREDAHMPVVVTDDLSAHAAPPTTEHVLSLDKERQLLSTVDDSNPGYPVETSNVAYVIYTSGSTGRPKGVVIEHRQAVNFVTAEVEHWPLGPGDRVLQFASLNFDVSVLDMFGALLSGATLVLARSETILSPPRLADLIRSAGVTFMCVPPAVLNLIADEQYPRLRVVIAGGEAFSSALVKKWVRPGLRFINGYGPTETTVGATMAECRDDGVDPPPIGLPLSNYTAYVLDSRLEPVPVGVAGELYLGGAGVARGYLNRPELTRERFVSDPFSALPGARLYKTGDVARRMADGKIQFLGRIDDQVKIRGLRVELGEIESVLGRHPSVRQTVVLVGEDRTGDEQLVGYARVDPAGSRPTQAELRQYLADRLPGFMVPPHVLVLDEFPLNANKKVDRARLPKPDGTGAGQEYRAPRTIVEAVLADTYGSLLNLDRVGADDSFFDLGGNSLQAMQLITRLRKDLAVDTDVTAIFLAPTPGQLAAVLREKHGMQDAALDDAPEEVPAAVVSGPASAGPLVRLSNGTGTTPLYLVHAIGGTVYAYASLAQEVGDTYEVWGIEAPGLRAGSSPATSLDELVTRYVAAIRAAQPTGPYHLGGWSFGGLISLAVAERLIAAGEEVAFVALLDAPLHVHEEVTQTEAELAAFYVADAARTLGAEAGEPPSARTASATEQLQWLAERVATEGDSAEVAADMAARFAVYEAHLRLIAGCVPPRVNVPVLVAGAADSTDYSKVWSAVLPGTVRAARVPGDHYSFLGAPGVQELAAELKSLCGKPSAANRLP